MRRLNRATRAKLAGALAQRTQITRLKTHVEHQKATLDHHLVDMAFQEAKGIPQKPRDPARGGLMILGADGKTPVDVEEKRLYSMLHHWLRLYSVRLALREARQWPNDNVLSRVITRGSDKGELATLVRKIISIKPAKRAIASVLANTVPDMTIPRAIRELDEISAELKERVLAARSGVILL